MPRLALTALLLAISLPAAAQVLARPGMTASGLIADPWWRQAVFYHVAAVPTSPTDYRSIDARLDALHTLGVDALLVPMPALPNSFAPDPALDDFDELVHQASRRGIRLLVTLPAPSASADLASSARFWLSRGVAGFHLVTPPGASPQDSQSMLQTLRKITGSAVGQRIVISSFNPDASPSPLASSTSRLPSRGASTRRSSRTGDSSGAQLQIDSQLSQLDLPDAATLRPLLAQSLLTPNLLLDFHPPPPPPSSPDPYPALARAMAAILLTTHSAALIDPDQDLADWYSRLSALHHGNPTVRYGSVSVLNFDSQNALVWVIRPAARSGLAPPVVVACNLSSSPLQLSLSAAVHSLNLRGSYLLTLLRSDQAMGPQDLDSVSLPPFAVYIGELHR
jgi:alpha-glucosidase